MFDRFNSAARRVLVAARDLKTPTDAEHLLLAVVREPDPEVGVLLLRLEVRPEAIVEDLRALGFEAPPVSPVSLAALEKKGFRRVKVLRAAEVDALIARAVDVVLAKRAAQAIEKLRAMKGLVPEQRTVDGLSLGDYTVRAVGALAAAIAESEALHHARAGPEHILLGLARVSDGATERVLRELGVGRDRVRALVKRMQPAKVKDRAPLACPRGHGAMETVQREGVVASLCPECMGTFFAPGELEGLFARLAGRTGQRAEDLRQALRRFLDPDVA